MPTLPKASLLVVLLGAAGVDATALPAQDKPKPAPAGKPAPKPPRLDQIAAQTLARWSRLEDRTARNAIRAIEFDIEVESKGGMTGTWKAKSRFRFDKRAAFPKAELKWEDAEVAAALQRRGWVAGTFANEFRDNEIAHQFAGAEITGAVKKNGSILSASGGRLQEETFLVFDKAGVLIATMVGPLRKRFFYEKRGEHFLRSGETYRLPESFGDVTISHGKVGNFYLTTSVREIVTIKGQVLSDLTFRFTNHKINAPPPKPQPATGKPPPGPRKQ